MNAFHDEIAAQPGALRDLIAWYRDGGGMARLQAVPPPNAPIMTGMGASWHALLATLPHLSRYGVAACAPEATDLVFYGAPLLQQAQQLVFVSQSGQSAEVEPILHNLPNNRVALAVTNNLDSMLAQHADHVLPLCAGSETTVATKTYLNSLATLWLLARHWGGVLNKSDLDILAAVADACQQIVEHGAESAAQWLDRLQPMQTLVFLGHGPHLATARQAALMLHEWAKLPARSDSIGGFRHGPIEIVQPGVGVVLFTAPGPAHASALALAQELRDYGAEVLVVEYGQIHDGTLPMLVHENIDEFLAPMLDAVPAQLFAEALARQRGVPPGFRYIGKVVTHV